MSTPAVAFVAVYHETNTFSSRLTSGDAFAARWYRGEQLTDAFAGTRTVGGGFFDGAGAAGLVVHPIFGAFATPSGVVTREAFDAILAEVDRGLAGRRFDGVLLELHGDLAVAGIDDPEEKVVALIRSRQPSVPIALVLDLHTNMAVPRFTDVEILVGYRTNPHVDTWECGYRAALLLADTIAGRLVPEREHAGLPVVSPPSAQLTSTEPLRSLFALADELERDPRLVDVSIHAGYAFGDSRATGMGFSATAREGARDVARQAVARLLALATRTIDDFGGDFPSAAEAVAQAVDATGRVAIADTGDNINGGSPGDTTWLAHEALRHPDTPFLLTLADADAVEAARSAGVGTRIALSIGGRAAPSSGGALTGDAEVLAVSDGVFHNEGPMATGARVDMRGAAVVRMRNLTVLLQSAPTQPNDSAMFRSLGIDPTEFRVVLLKGAAALRADWSDRVDRIIDAGTPGETDQVLSRLTYRHATRTPDAPELVDHQDVVPAPAMFPSAARLGQRLVVVWSDTPDGWPGGRALSAWSDDDGRSWSPPVVVATPADDEDSVVSALSLTPRPDGTALRFVYNGVSWPTPEAADRVLSVWVVESADGQHWSEPTRLPAPYAFPAVYGEMVPVEGGEIMPIWGRRTQDEHWRSGVLFASDTGQWEERGTIGWAPVATLDDEYVGGGSTARAADTRAQITEASFRPHDVTGGFNETSVQRDADGRLRAIVRQQGVAGASDALALFTSTSEDDGRTWTPPRELGFAGTSPCLRILPDGRLLLAYRRTVNDHVTSAAVEVRIGTANAAAWSAPLVLPTGTDAPLPYEYQVGYPAIVTSAMPDERLVVHYSFSPAAGRGLRLARIRVPESR